MKIFCTFTNLKFIELNLSEKLLLTILTCLFTTFYGFAAIFMKNK